MFLRLLFCCVSVMAFSYADEVIWKGEVNSDGTPTKLINLKIHDQYQIKVSKQINLGKWIQANDQLANDACFEFGEKVPPKNFESLKNSNNISVCDGNYHKDHVYTSEAFIAKQDRIFFWIHDTHYDDNSGALEVEVIHKTK